MKIIQNDIYQNFFSHNFMFNSWDSISGIFIAKEKIQHWFFKNMDEACLFKKLELK